MKTFREFMFECLSIGNKISLRELIAESTRGGPDYDYEQSFVNFYNHMVNKSDSEGADMRELFRGAVQRRDIFTITDLIAKEVQRAQTDPTSPLYFDNLDSTDPGFTGGKRSKSGEVSDKEAHRQAYYDKLLNQQYSLLNFVQSKSGRIQAAKGHVAEREGATKVPLTAKAREITGKNQDTSKVDVSFIDDSGNRYGISLKDAKGAVVNSSGAEETKSYILLGINTLLDQQEKVDKIITPEQRAEKEAMGKELADQLALYMSSTRGMSKEQQKDALPQMQEYLNSIESIIPGTIQAMSAEAITGKGKYGDASTVDALFSTGRGGEVIEDPSWLAQYVFQRGRLGKGTSKTKAGAIQRPTTIAGDIKNYQDAEGKPKTSEYLNKWETDWGKPAWEKKIATFEPEIQDEIRRLQNNDEFGLDDLYNYENQDIEVKQLKASESKSQAQQKLKTQQDAQAATGPIDPEAEAQAQQELETQQAAQALKDAEKEKEEAQKAIETNPDGSKTYLQYQGQKIQNNPELNTRLVAANQNIQTASVTLDTIRQRAAQAQQRQTQPAPVQTQPTQPAPEQQPVQTQPPMVKSKSEPYKKDAIDRDGDGLVQDGTPHERPAPAPEPKKKKNPAERMASAYDKKVDELIRT